MIDFVMILASRYADKKWAISGEDYDGLEWMDDSPKPSRAELAALWDEVRAEKKKEKEDKVSARAAVLKKLKLSEEEVALLLG